MAGVNFKFLLGGSMFFGDIELGFPFNDLTAGLLLEVVSFCLWLHF